jgi:hypothetical protein
MIFWGRDVIHMVSQVKRMNKEGGGWRENVALLMGDDSVAHAHGRFV